MKKYDAETRTMGLKYTKIGHGMLCGQSNDDNIISVLTSFTLIVVLLDTLKLNHSMCSVVPFSVSQ